MDIDRLLRQQVANNNDRVTLKNFIQAQGPRQSANEHLIPEQLFDNPDTVEKEVEGVSAVKALQIASQQGQKIFNINKRNKDKILPLISHNRYIMHDIKNALNAGKHVQVHEKTLRYKGWKGTGYVILDPKTGAGAYLIGGGVDGGVINKTIDLMNSVLYGVSAVLGTTQKAIAIFNQISSVLNNIIASIKRFYKCNKDLIESVAFTMVVVGLIGFLALSATNPATAPIIALTVLTISTQANAAKKKNKDCREKQCDFEESERNSRSRKQFGHAFLEHGQKNSVEQLRDRANTPPRPGKKPISDQQGRWTNDEMASRFIFPYVGNQGIPNLTTGNIKPIIIDIPPGIGFVIHKDRNEPPEPTTKAFVVLNSTPGVNGQNCIRTAYPVTEKKAKGSK